MAKGDDKTIADTVRVYHEVLGDLRSRLDPTTRSLNLSGSEYTVNDLALLKRGGDFLQAIDLSHTTVGGGMEHVGALTGLRGILLRGVQFPNTSELRYLAALPQLEALFVGGTNLDDAGMAALAPLFQGPKPRMKRMEIGQTQVTSAGLGLIQSLQPAGSLLLAGLPVSPEDVVRFRGFQLKRLSIGGPTISPAVIEMLFEGFAELRDLEFLHINDCDDVLAELWHRKSDVKIRRV